MNTEDFSHVVANRIDKIGSVLQAKAKEYAKADRLHNFKVASNILNCIPEKALIGMYAKHLVSVLDMVNDIDSGIKPTEYLINEKIGDSINYMILLEALLIERLHE